MARWIKACIFFLLFIISITLLLSKLSSNSKPRVVLLKSHATLRVFGITGQQEWQQAESTLVNLGINYQEISDEFLEKADLDYDLIILPNVRCLSKESADSLRRFLSQGGKILAFYQSGYRDQNNRLIGHTNNFHISDILGADFYVWTNNPPACEFLKFEAPPFKRQFPLVQLARNTAMLIKPHPGSEILAKFVDSDKVTYSAPNKLSAAIIANEEKNCIYCGENLLVSENSASPEVKRLIAALMNYLVPGIVELEPQKIVQEKKFYLLPYQTEFEIKPTGEALKIRVADKLSSIAISSNGQVELVFRTPTGLKEIKRSRGEILYINPAGPGYLGIYSADKKFLGKTRYPIKAFSCWGQPLNLVKINKNKTYRLQGFRGSILIELYHRKLRVVNYLTLEEYLAGVVPNEMPQYFPEEALKAMAVVARTFALANIKRHTREGFNLCSSVHCQVYEGILSEQSSTLQAIKDTSGEIIVYPVRKKAPSERGEWKKRRTVWGEFKAPFKFSNEVYEGRLANTPFHACCGGMTDDVKRIWNRHRYTAYLSSVSDVISGKKPYLGSEEGFRRFIDKPPLCYCSESGRFRWKETFTQRQIEEFLKDSLPFYFGLSFINLGELKDLKIVKRTPAGRVSLLEIKTSLRNYYVKGDAVRWIFTGGEITTGGLPSTFFYIDKAIETNSVIYTFTGGGWGHGVGLCQEGALGLAKAGFNYKEIIKHYYEGVEIVK